MKLFPIIALAVCLMLSGCINASPAFAWRCVSYQSTPEAGQDIKLEQKPGDATVNAEKTTSDAFKIPEGAAK